MIEADFTIYAVFGFLGVALYLGSYAALQTGYIRGQGGLYALLNLGAASCVLVSLVEAFNMSSAIIQIFWIVISIVGLTRMYLLQRRIHFSPEEAELVRGFLPNLSKSKARKFLNAGHWITGEAGTRLTEEGTPNEHLIYLAQGTATIESSDQTIAICEGPAFIGELTAISGEPATATACLNSPSLYFCINAEYLRKRVRKDSELRIHLESSFSRQMLQKLKASNRALAEKNVVAKS